ncbi:hypothetical protein IMSAGC006_02104 [Muribaculaceae bacterium]|nr:hypothetical protein IMSAGC006_02104 [Muribaculaceae bacterium]
MRYFFANSIKVKTRRASTPIYRYIINFKLNIIYINQNCLRPNVKPINDFKHMLFRH